VTRRRRREWEPGEALFVADAEMTTTEDTYAEGEVGRETIVWQGDGLPPGPYYGYEELLSQLADIPGAPEGKDAWVVYGDEDSLAGRIEAQWLVNDENYAASPEEITSWRKGKTQLWSARLTVYLIAVRIYGPPKAEDIAKATGFEVV